MGLEEGKKVDINGQNLFNYQHAINLDCSNQNTNRGWLEMGIRNEKKHVMERQNDKDN